MHSTTQDHETEPGSQCPGLHVALFGSQSSVATGVEQEGPPRAARSGDSEGAATATVADKHILY